MENPAATSLRQQFRRHGSGHNIPQLRPDVPSSSEEDESPEPDENTNLLSRPWSRVSQKSYHLRNDGRPYVAYPFKVIHTTWRTLASSYVNFLLVFVPLGIIAGAVGWSSTATFVLNFLAIIPLAALLSFATEELSVKLGQTLGGLMNATFGNAVELIVLDLTTN